MDRTQPSEGCSEGSTPSRCAAGWRSLVVLAGPITRRSRGSNPAPASGDVPWRDRGLISRRARVRAPSPPPSRCDPVWLGCLLREQEVVSSNLTTSTGSLCVTEARESHKLQAKVQLLHEPPCQGGEMVDALGSEPSGRKVVLVRLQSLASCRSGEMVDTLARGASGREAVEVRLLSATLNASVVKR